MYKFYIIIAFVSLSKVLVASRQALYGYKKLFHAQKKIQLGWYVFIKSNFGEHLQVAAKLKNKKSSRL